MTRMGVMYLGRKAAPSCHQNKSQATEEPGVHQRLMPPDYEHTSMRSNMLQRYP